MNPNTLIPLTTLALSCAIAGCSDPIVGEWELTEVGGYLREIENEYDAEFYGTLIVDDEMEAEMELGFCYSYDGDQECDSYSDDGEVEVDDNGGYEIDFDEAESFNCEFDGDELVCEMDDCDDCELVFEKAN